MIVGRQLSTVEPGVGFAAAAGGGCLIPVGWMATSTRERPERRRPAAAAATGRDAPPRYERACPAPPDAGGRPAPRRHLAGSRPGRPRGPAPTARTGGRLLWWRRPARRPTPSPACGRPAPRTPCSTKRTVRGAPRGTRRRRRGRDYEPARRSPR